MTLKHKYAISCVAAFLVVGTAVYANTRARNPVTIREIHLIYPVDYADGSILMGASHNVFVGKVIRQIGTRNRGLGVETQFAVHVVLNLKGDLQGNVTVNQEGGYQNGVLYVIADGTESQDIDGHRYLIRPGFSYLFATRYSPTYDWYTLNPFPTASKVISTNSALDASELRNIASSDSRVMQLQNIYPNEKAFYADIAHNNTRNSYRSLSGDQKVALKYGVLPPAFSMPTSTGQVPALPPSTPTFRSTSSSSFMPPVVSSTGRSASSTWETSPMESSDTGGVSASLMDPSDFSSSSAASSTMGN
jgi:hypothetical protein